MTSARENRSQASSIQDCLENYELLDQMSDGTRSVVYSARCKRGRLRGRLVALKEVPTASLHSREETAIEHLSTTLDLHHSLHHPSVVSVFSTFSYPLAHYQVLELCPRGNLASYLRHRQPLTLTEPELRGVTKSLIDALTYLRKERIIHRNIACSNVLLTDDYRVKLADFTSAIQLRTEDSLISDSCVPQNTAPPFSADLWSLGYLMFTCMSGDPDLAGNTKDKPPSTSNLMRQLELSTSLEAKDLISGLLQINPEDRIPLHRSLSHPFFGPALPTHPLRPIDDSPMTDVPSQIVLHHKTQGGKVPSAEDSGISACSRSKAGSDRASELTMHKTSGRDQKYPSLGILRPPLQERKNLQGTRIHELKAVLQDEATLEARKQDVAACHGRSHQTDKLPGRRNFSAPVSVPHTSLASEYAALLDKPRTRSITHITSSRLAPSPPAAPRIEETVNPLLLPPRPNLDIPVASKVKVRRRSPLPKTSTAKPRDHIRHRLPSAQPVEMALIDDFQDADQRASDQRVKDEEHTRSPSPPISAVPIGTTRPQPFSIGHLRPQTHKLAGGQLTILPSRLLFVDLREGEQRKGRRGGEVFVVDADRRKVRVYSTPPQLSDPRCLAEPDAEYAVDTLPAKYWKQYNEAARLVEEVKRKTAKFVLYNPEAKCTLMSNEPEADIELLFPAPDPAKPYHHDRKRSLKDVATNMRIRFSRKERAVEIAVLASSGSKEPREWIKNVYPALNPKRLIDKETWSSLGSTERDGVKQVIEFLRVCETLEGSNGSLTLTGSSSENQGQDDCSMIQVPSPEGTGTGESSSIPSPVGPVLRNEAFYFIGGTSNSTSSTKTGGSLDSIVPRRPCKFFPAEPRIQEMTATPKFIQLANGVVRRQSEDAWTDSIGHRDWK